MWAQVRLVPKSIPEQHDLGRELNNGSGQGEMNETADPFTITIHFTQNKLHKQGKPNKAKD